MSTEPALSTTDYEEVLADHRRLVRRLDVILNGEKGAAQQASLCDIVGQVEHRGLVTQDALDAAVAAERERIAMWHDEQAVKQQAIANDAEDHGHRNVAEHAATIAAVHRRSAAAIRATPTDTRGAG